MKILSIIVPSYNTEKHIDRCVPFFLEAKRRSEIEIIFVNDGSTDNTVLKLKKYEEKCPETVRIVTKKNGGHGSAVNVGIKEATGKYFKVVDGDDWVEANNLDRLVKQLKSTDSDLVLNPFYRVSQITGERILDGIWNVEKNRKIPINNLPKQIYGLPLHSWTIKSAILKENNIHFTENCFYDDLEYITFPIPYIKNFLFLDFPVYNYLVDQATQSVSDESVFNNYKMSKRIVFELLRYYINGNKKWSLRAKKYFLDTSSNAVKQHYNIYLRNGKDKTAYLKFRTFDAELFQKFQKMYRYVGRKYFYIKILQKGNKLTFTFASLLLRKYKKMYNKSIAFHKIVEWISR